MKATLRWSVRLGATLVLVVTSCSSPPEVSSGSSLEGASLVQTTETTASLTTKADAAHGSTTEPGLPAPEKLIGEYEPQIIATFPHDPEAFTQGLEMNGGVLVESVGEYERSGRRLVAIESGEVLRSVDLNDSHFGEGLTLVGDELIQLTWRSGVYFRSDAATLERTGSGMYEGEGWGLCYDGAELFMSNGSSELTVRDPNTFEAQRLIPITRSDGSPVSLLNELECVGTQVLANIFRSDEIVAIDSVTGVVQASIDARSLRPPGAPADDSDYALNGIAYNEVSGTFYITGKWWPVLYEVSFESS